MLAWNQTLTTGYTRSNSGVNKGDENSGGGCVNHVMINHIEDKDSWERLLEA